MTKTTLETTESEEYPLVTAIMLAGKTSIEDTLHCIQCFKTQTYPYKELIIVNNAEDQFKASEFNLQAEPDIFIIDTPTEVSAGMARNFGIRAANGQILAQFDADNYHAPNRLESQIAALSTNDAHICILASTLSYSYLSGRANYLTNEKEAILSTMVFIRPSGIDYPDYYKYEEFGLLDKMIATQLRPIAIRSPELCCKLTLTSGDRIEQPINAGITTKEFKLIKQIVQNRQKSPTDPILNPIVERSQDEQLIVSDAPSDQNSESGK